MPEILNTRKPTTYTNARYNFESSDSKFTHEIKKLIHSHEKRMSFLIDR